MRPLGIATFAVKPIGLGTDDRGDGVWVQQRALDKAIDPRRRDMLAGGLMAAGATPRYALERKTWEEAGLRIADLQDLRPMERLTIRRPVSEGYLVEHIDVFEAVVPEALLLANQDGEVERFECVAPEALADRLAQRRFTLEAALMLAASLLRRGLL